MLQSRISTLTTDLWSIRSQRIWLLLCVGSIWVKNSHLSAYMLTDGVASSRLGLWMFDLAVIQQMQDLVRESGRRVVGGVQTSLQSTMDLMAYIMGIIISNPEGLWKLNLLSFGAITLASFLYTYHLYQIRTQSFNLQEYGNEEDNWLYPAT